MRRCDRTQRPRLLRGSCWLAAAALWLATAPPLSAQTDPADSRPGAPPAVHLIPVPLPITGTVDTNVIQLVDHVLARQGGRSSPDQRPIVILDFRTADEETGEGSQFERSLALARYLAGEKLRSVRTVAFLRRTVVGHAVLPVLACEELIMAPDAELGDAGAGESFLDPTVRRGYVEIAERRRTIPTPIVLGMLDPAIAVYKVQTQDGARFVVGDELESLQRETAVRSVETVKREGDRGRFTGRDLRLKFGLAGHLAEDETALAAALRVPVRSIEWDPSVESAWRALRVDLHGPLNAKVINWVLRGLERRVEAGSHNLIVLAIDSPGGAAVDSLSFASYLASLPDGIRTVAFVPHEARADAGLIALACDHLVLGEGALLGGPGADIVDALTLDDARTSIQEIAARQRQPWSPLLAMFDPTLELHRYTREGTGETRLLCAEEWQALADRDSWRRGADVSLRTGLSGTLADELGLVRHRTSSFDELKRFYQLDGNPETIRPTWAHVLVESLASPRIAWLLLFVAWFALMVEFMTPNLTGAGFVSGLCFLLYFWSQFLHGTAGWLEVLLFLAGVVCVAIEIFVIPGFGLFGFGGGVLIIVSLVLASQTFVIPRNEYQLSQLPVSLMTVAAGGAGMIAGLVLIRRLLPHSPLFRRMMLAPPAADQIQELERREALVDWTHLLGATGVTTTSLMPSGKARFGDELIDVITEGEMLERGTSVIVVECLGNRVIVRART